MILPKAMDNTEENIRVPIKKAWDGKSHYMLIFSQVVSSVWLPTFFFFQ